MFQVVNCLNVSLAAKNCCEVLPPQGKGPLNK